MSEIMSQRKLMSGYSEFLCDRDPDKIHGCFFGVSRVGETGDHESKKDE